MFMCGETLGGRIDKVIGADPAAMSAAERHAAIGTALDAETQLAAGFAGLLGTWDAEGDWADDGSLSASARLARDHRVSERCARQVFRARRLREMPVRRRRRCRRA